MKLVFLGTSELAAQALSALQRSAHQVSLVVTQPDRGAGRGRKPAPPPVKTEALSLGLPVTQPESVNTRVFRALIREHDPDVLVVAAFGQFLRPLLLAIPPKGCLNVHASILPRHRGASPINAAILAGDEEVGVSIMKMDEGMDTGPVGLVGRLPANPEETAGELHDRLAVLGGELIVQALDRLDSGTLEFVAQDEDKATHAPKLSKQDGLVQFDCDVVQTRRQIRGLSPWPGCYGDLETKQGVKRVILGTVEAEDRSFAAEPGEVLAADGTGLRVACRRGVLVIKELKPAGKRKMSVADFLNGTTVEVGARFKGARNE